MNFIKDNPATMHILGVFSLASCAAISAPYGWRMTVFAVTVCLAPAWRTRTVVDRE